MSDLIKITTLEDIEDKYNIFFIDLWGVIHNGLELFENAGLSKLPYENKNDCLERKALDYSALNLPVLREIYVH